MCWLTNAWPSTTRVIVFFRSAPSARIGRSSRDRRDGAGRIAARTAQNRGPENSGARHRIVHAPGDRALANQERVGDSEPAGRGRRSLRRRSARSSGSRWSSPEFRARRRRRADGAAACKAASRRVRCCRARLRGNRSLRGAMTMGRATDVRSASASGDSSTISRAASRFRAISANGFSLRYLRSRRAWIAAAFRRVTGEMVASEPFHRDDFAGLEKLAALRMLDSLPRAISPPVWK